MLRVFLNRNAAIFLTVSLISGFGSTAMGLAAGVWAKTLTGSDSLAALTLACTWLPLLLGPALGTIVDRVRRRRLLVTVNAALAAAMPVLFLVRSPGWLPLLCGVLLGYGVAGVLATAAEDALLPAVVPTDLLGDLNGLRMTAQESTKLAAPLAGVALYSWLGGPAVALLDAATFAVAAVAYCRLRLDDRLPEPAHHHGRRLTHGIHELLRHRDLRNLVTVGATMMLLSGVGSAASYAMVDKGLHHPPTFLGVLAVAQGLGSLAGGLLTGPFMRRRSATALAATGGLLFAAGLAAAAIPSVPAVLAAKVAVGLGLPWVIVATITVMQRTVPNAVLGRVSATVTTVLFAPTGIAIATGAGLLTFAGYQAIYLVSGAVATVAALTLVRSHREIEPQAQPVPAEQPMPAEVGPGLTAPGGGPSRVV